MDKESDHFSNSNIQKMPEIIFQDEFITATWHPGPVAPDWVTPDTEVVVSETTNARTFAQALRIVIRGLARNF